MKGTLTKILFFILSYLSPISTIAHVMIIFVAIDLISAIWVACKLSQPIVSNKLRRTLTKLVWYILALVMAHMFETTFNTPWIHFAQIVGGFICMIEIKSVFENITKITDEPVFMRIYKLFERNAKSNTNLKDD